MHKATANGGDNKCMNIYEVLKAVGFGNIHPVHPGRYNTEKLKGAPESSSSSSGSSSGSSSSSSGSSSSGSSGSSSSSSSWSGSLSSQAKCRLLLGLCLWL